MSFRPDDNFDDGMTPRLTDAELAATIAADTARKEEICQFCGGSNNPTADRYCGGDCQE